MDLKLDSECAKKTAKPERCLSLSDPKRPTDVGRDCRRDDTPPASCLVLCGPRTCATLPPNLSSQDTGAPSEPKRKRLWGLRGLVKMFRRRVRRKGGDTGENQHPPPPTLRTRSASELAVDQANRTNSGPYNQGLSVSHDSVFSPESPSEETNQTPSGLALVTRGVNMSELKAALRRRRGDDQDSGDDDPGLPRSPPTSPTTVDVLNHGLKSTSRATRSTCSDASLLSMGSSENDEDSFGISSHHSSRSSLIESQKTLVDHEPAAGAVPLSHKAARHKMAVRPRRTRATPRTKMPPQVLATNLPSTPEVNEDSSFKSITTQHLSTRCYSSMKTSYSAETTSSIEYTQTERDFSRSPLHDNSFGEKLEDHFAKILAGGGPRSSGMEHRSDEVFFRKSPTEPKKPVDLRMSSPEMVKAIRSSDIFHKRNSESTFAPSSSPRSSSVEGRLEGNTTESQEIVPSNMSTSLSPSSQKPPIAPPQSGTRDGVDHHFVCTSYVVERSSSNFPSESLLPKEKAESSFMRSSRKSLNKRSSTDNLTSTQLPGVFIRPYSAHCVTESTVYNANVDAPKPVDFDSGPLSLDSSIMSVHSEDEPVKKAVSLDKAIGSNCRDSDHLSKKTREQHTTGVGRSQSINSPSSYVKKMRENRNDPYKDDSPNLPIKVQREPSFTKTKSESKSVPEFMRIQLNRVQNKSSSVVFDTEVETDTASSPPRNPEPKPTETVLKDETEQHDHTEPLSHSSITRKSSSSGDEIVLRRPSVIDKAVLLDQSVALKRPSLKSRDEPELMKVFARRSFKLKDSDGEEDEDSDSIPDPEETKSNDASPEVEKKDCLPTLRSISSKRYSLGSCPIPFNSRGLEPKSLGSTAKLGSKESVLEEDVSPKTTNEQKLVPKQTIITNPVVLRKPVEITERKVDSSESESTSPNSTISSSFSRRSFSHFSSKSPLNKGLSRTSSANQSDSAFQSAIIKQATATKQEAEVASKPSKNTVVQWPPRNFLPEQSEPSKKDFSEEPKSEAETNEVKFRPKPGLIRSATGNINPKPINEARNTSLGQSFTGSPLSSNISSAKSVGTLTKEEPEDQPAADWKVLIRKRREDRMKQSKSTEADDILIESRPTTARNSKVLEMANNFQKLQVA